MKITGHCDPSWNIIVDFIQANYVKLLNNGFYTIFCRSELVTAMKSGPYSISTDGSNDNGITKMYPIVVTIPTETGIRTQFLDMCTGTSATAEG